LLNLIWILCWTFLSVVYVSGISAVAAKYIFVAAKDMSLFKKQSVTYYF